MIHSTAIIDPTAKIAANVEIGAYSIIGADVEIGEGTTIAPHVVIKGPTKIGKDNRIYQFASLGESSQALGEEEFDTLLEIGDRNTIREYATMNRGMHKDGGVTRIGNDNLMMAYTHIAHDCQLDNHIVMSNGVTLGGHVHIGEHAVLGGFTLVHQFCKIGQHAFTGMGSAINQDVTPYTTVAGTPTFAFDINKEGLRRRGFSPEVIRALRKAFMVLIRSRKVREEAFAEAAPLAEQYKEVARFVEFIRNSERGITRSR